MKGLPPSDQPVRVISAVGLFSAFGACIDNEWFVRIFRSVQEQGMFYQG
jgi:hypothetical protein